MVLVTIAVFDIALSLIKGIVALRQITKTNDQRALDLIDRINCLEQPLVALKGKYQDQIHGQALYKLARTLESAQLLLEQYLNQGVVSRRIVKVFKYEDKFDALQRSLDQSIQDLAIALQAEEATSKDKTPLEGAIALLTLMEDQRLTSLKEEIRVCVQCNQGFRESENAPGSCAFHPVLTAEWDASAYSRKIRCCNIHIGQQFDSFPANGCSRGLHKAFHHREYPYLNYLGAIRTAIEDAEVWLEVTQEDLEHWEGNRTGKFGRLRTGQLCFWAMQNTEPVYMQIIDDFDIETPTSLTTDSPFAEINNMTTPMSDPRSNARWFVRGEWIIVDKMVSGVRILTETPTNEKPNIGEITLSIDPVTPGNVSYPYFDAVRSQDLMPQKIYTVSAPASNFIPLGNELFAENPPPLPSFGQAGDLKLRIKQMKPCQANPDGSTYKSDIFVNHLMLVHSGKPASTQSTSVERITVLTMLKDKTITVEEADRLLGAMTGALRGEDSFTLIEVRVEYSDDEGTTWKPCDYVEAQVISALGDGSPAPFNLLEMKPREIVKMTLKSSVLTPGKNKGWYGRSFLARLRPIHFRIILEESMGATACLHFVYRNPPMEKLPSINPSTDFFFLGVDDDIQFERIYVKIIRPETKPSPQDLSQQTERTLFQIQVYNSVTYTTSVTPLQIRKWIYQASQKAFGGITKREQKSGVTMSTQLVELDLQLDGNCKGTGLFDVTSDGKGIMYGIRCRVEVPRDESIFAEDTWVIPPAIFAEN
ncbi:hypothetical protein HK102_005758 [Quaeritorhiza haematococci]|nr:hypothetical protein HK102_005758 [Quaeritorhiza haematococci]